MKHFNFLFFVLISLSLYGQRDWNAVEIRSEQVASNVYVLYGVGGNIGLAVGDDYAYLIDAQFAPLTDKILAAVKEITPLPIKFLVNTHWHDDHTGGNLNMNAQGTTIIAHENVRNRMGSVQKRSRGRISQPSPFKALPEITFTDELFIHLNPTETMHVMHVSSAHTDGDSYVYFPQQSVLHMGDNFFNRGYPYIDLASRGSINGLIENIDRALIILDEDSKIIPGHGTVAKRKDLVFYGNMLKVLRERVQDAKAAGNSLETIQKMGLSSEWDASFGTGFIKPDQIITFIFNGL